MEKKHLGHCDSQSQESLGWTEGDRYPLEWFSQWVTHPNVIRFYGLQVDIVLTNTKKYEIGADPQKWKHHNLTHKSWELIY